MMAFVVGVIVVSLVGSALLLQRWATDRRRADAVALEQVRVELDRLQVAHDRMVEVVGSLPVGVVVVDPDGAVVLRNEVAAEFASARHGRAVVESAVEAAIAKARGGDVADATVQIHGVSRRTLEVSAEPIAGSDPSTGLVATIVDVTELERSEAIRRDFVANVAHELKTPIGALCLLAETLTPDADADVRGRLVERIHAESARLASMIDDLMTLSMLEGETPHSAEVVDLIGVVDAALERVAVAAERSGVSLARGATSERLDVAGSRVQLESAVFNLVDNAVKYCDRGGSVGVRVSSSDDLVAVAVHDDGCGIPAADVPRIFERFYRVDQARSRDTGGSGLGLALVRHVVVNHSGEVDVMSREGEGSTFTIVLPALDDVGAR